MQIKNRKFAMAIVVFAAMLLISMELPYNDKAVIQYILPIIRIKKASLHLAGILTIAGFIWCYSLIVKSKRFNASRLMIFICLFVFVIPVAARNIHIIKTPVYYFSSGVRSIEVVESRLRLSQEGEDEILNMYVELKSYRHNYDGIRVGVVLDDSYKEYIVDTRYMSDEKYRLGKNQSINISESLPVNFKDDNADNNNFYTNLDNIDYKIVLRDDERTSILNRNDSY